MKTKKNLLKIEGELVHKKDVAPVLASAILSIKEIDEKALKRVTSYLLKEEVFDGISIFFSFDEEKSSVCFNTEMYQSELEDVLSYYYPEYFPY